MADVERASAVGEATADDTADGRAAIRDGEQVEGEVIRDAFGYGAHVEIGQALLS